MRSIFVTGTDTDIGKTVVSAALTLGLGAYYWKPIQAGTEPSTDTRDVRAWTGLPRDRTLDEEYVLRSPMSPHAAAELDGIEIDPSRITRRRLPDDRPIVVEGAGGLMVPVSGTSLIVDLISDLRIPVVLVARTSLGTLNHTLLSLSELDRRGIPVLGVVFNGEPHESNREAIEHYGRTPVLGRIPRLDNIDEVNLRIAFDNIDVSYFI